MIANRRKEGEHENGERKNGKLKKYGEICARTELEWDAKE